MTNESRVNRWLLVGEENLVNTIEKKDSRSRTRKGTMGDSADSDNLHQEKMKIPSKCILKFENSAIVREKQMFRLNIRFRLLHFSSYVSRKENNIFYYFFSFPFLLLHDGL